MALGVLRLIFLTVLILSNSVLVRAQDRTKIKEDVHGNKYLYQKFNYEIKKIYIGFKTDDHAEPFNLTKSLTILNNVASKANKNSNSSTLLFNGGDVFEKDQYTLNSVNAELASIYNVFLPGNHDFENIGVQNLINVAKEFKINMIASNFKKIHKDEFPLPRYKIIDYKNASILIIGITHLHANQAPEIRIDYEFESAYQTMQYIEQKVFPLFPKIKGIVVLTHLPRSNANVLIDFLDSKFSDNFLSKIIGVYQGHEHKGLGYYKYAYKNNKIPDLNIVSGGFYNRNVQTQIFDFDDNKFTLTKYAMYNAEKHMEASYITSLVESLKLKYSEAKATSSAKNKFNPSKVSINITQPIIKHDNKTLIKALNKIDAVLLEDSQITDRILNNQISDLELQQELNNDLEFAKVTVSGSDLFKLFSDEKIILSSGIEFYNTISRVYNSDNIKYKQFYAATSYTILVSRNFFNTSEILKKYPPSFTIDYDFVRTVKGADVVLIDDKNANELAFYKLTGQELKDFINSEHSIVLVSGLSFYEKNKKINIKSKNFKENRLYTMAITASMAAKYNFGTPISTVFLTSQKERCSSYKKAILRLLN